MDKYTTITEAEEQFCFYKLGVAGSGMTALIDAMFAVDQAHRDRLRNAFPDLIEVVENYLNRPGYWTDLQRRFKHSVNPVS